MANKQDIIRQVNAYLKTHSTLDTIEMLIDAVDKLGDMHIELQDQINELTEITLVDALLSDDRCTSCVCSECSKSNCGNCRFENDRCEECIDFYEEDDDWEFK